MKLYDSRICRVVTLHRKEDAIRPSFESILGMKTIPFEINTDLLGTFSGEVERKLTPKLCAKEKCLTALKMLPTESLSDCLIASEGTFGPHPHIPFAVSGFEILYFMDCKLDFELYISRIFPSTNFASAPFSDWVNIMETVPKWGFPTHALIVRPNIWNHDLPIFKGIAHLTDLEKSFYTCRQLSSDSKVWIGTDMRAHKNPTRMETIATLAETLAHQLNCLCPSCNTPGWGIVRHVPGLPCSDCYQPTELIHHIEYGCCKCAYLEKKPRKNGLTFAGPEHCPSCNP